MSGIGFIVIGEPGAQGSKTHVGGGRMIESSKKVGPWRDAVSAAAVKAIEAQGLTFQTGPLEVTITFWLRRPVSLPKKVLLPWKRPDLDKLVRSTLDGLTTSGVWGDDGQAQRIVAEKQYQVAGGATGAQIAIVAL